VHGRAFEGDFFFDARVMNLTDSPCPSKFVILQIGPCGRGVHATKSFKKGEEIFQEPPLLSAPIGALSARLEAFARLGAEDKSFVLSSLDRVKESDFLARLKKSVNELGPLPGDLSGDDALRFEEVFQCNCFEVGEEAALFRWSSFMNHSCDLCPVVTLNQNGQKVWIAARDISKGEELTTSYLSRYQLLVGRKQRQIFLNQRGFKCQCKRCQGGFDMTAACACPKCGPRRSAKGLLVEGVKNVDLTPLLNIPPTVCDLTKYDRGVERCWMCLTCNSWFTSKEVDPKGIFEVDEELFINLLFRPKMETRRSVLLQGYYSTAMMHFGPLHWSTKLSEIHFLDVAFSHIRLGLPLRQLEEKDLGYERGEIMESLVPVWCWLDVIAPFAPTSGAFAASIINYIDVADTSDKQKMEMLRKIATECEIEDDRKNAASKFCWECAASGEKSKLLCCSKCKLASYCNVACQKAGWGAHSGACKQGFPINRPKK